MELIKNVSKWGNSAGILLPKEWLGNKVRVVLLEDKKKIKKKVFEILENYLSDILGIYLIGSYARNEQTKESDIDILAISKNINKKINIGKYQIIIISEEELKKQLNENTLPILVMLREAKVILNSSLIDKYKTAKLNKKNIKYYIETTKSALEFIKKDVGISRKLGQKASDASAYSLVLRLRTFYLIECIKKNKIGNKKDFLKLIKKVSGSDLAYQRYVLSKNKKTLDYKLPLEQAEKLIKYLNKKIHEFKNE